MHVLREQISQVMLDFCILTIQEGMFIFGTILGGIPVLQIQDRNERLHTFNLDKEGATKILKGLNIASMATLMFSKFTAFLNRVFDVLDRMEENELFHDRKEASVRRQMNIELKFPPNFEGLVLGSIDANFCKKILV